jgi:hypothetical protein
MRVASRSVFLHTPREAATDNSWRAVPGGNSPSRIRRRRMEATWSATEVLLISASSMIWSRLGAEQRHVAPNREASQVFNNSHFQQVSSLALTCLQPLHSVVPFFLLMHGRGMGSSRILRLATDMNGLPEASHALPSFQPQYCHPWCPAAKFLRSCAAMWGTSVSAFSAGLGFRPQRSAVEAGLLQIPMV